MMRGEAAVRVTNFFGHMNGSSGLSNDMAKRPSAGTDPLYTLWAGSVAGRPEDLEALTRALSGPIYRLALRTLGHPTDAEDASQEILVTVVTHLSQFRAESKLLTWVYTIAVRHLLRFRKGRSEREVQMQAVGAAIEAGLAHTGPGDVPDGEVRVLAREVRLACTQSMLFALNREERLAVLLAELLGADDTQGAAICGTSPQTFRKRLSRGRLKLRPVLEEKCGLHRPERPCRCARQAAAKQRHGPRKPPRWTALPVDDQARVRRAHDQMRAVSAVGAVFAFDPPIAAPATLWEKIAPRLADVLAP